LAGDANGFSGIEYRGRGYLSGKWREHGSGINDRTSKEDHRQGAVAPCLRKEYDTCYLGSRH
jgi:hypothetical protein